MKRQVFLHKCAYAFSYLIAPLTVRKYGYRRTRLPKSFKPEGPYMVMANHTTESDMAVMISAFPKHMYFVCGEHLFRSKNAKKIRRFYDPIPEFKGTVATGTVMEIFRRIKNGHNIMIFPEGSRSFNGETIPVSEATGKLVKQAKCGLVTYRIWGGYFIAPRWGYNFTRRGRIAGEFVNYYTAEELAEMTPAEIKAVIDRDIYENAYARQRRDPKPYAGEGLAEGLENFLVKCPECGAYDALVSKGNDFWCSKCGLRGTYTETGFLESVEGGKRLPFDSVYDWGKWIERAFDDDMITRSEDEIIFEEKGLKLYEITRDHRQIDIATGDMTVTRKGFSMAGHEFPFAAIPAMSMLYFGKTLLFTFDDRFYGITGESFHAWKTNRLYDISCRA